MISFKANYLGQTTIKRIGENNTFLECKATLVELDPNSGNDEKALGGLHEDWGPADKYSQSIHFRFLDKSYQPNYYNELRFFALTRQIKNFENLRREDILGIAQISKNYNDDIKINYLQTNPEYMVHNHFRNFKGIGSALLKAIEKAIPKGNIRLTALPSTIEFYEKLGYAVEHKLGAMIKKR